MNCILATIGVYKNTITQQGYRLGQFEHAGKIKRCIYVINQYEYTTRDQGHWKFEVQIHPEPMATSMTEVEGSMNCHAPPFSIM